MPQYPFQMGGAATATAEAAAGLHREEREESRALAAVVDVFKHIGPDGHAGLYSRHNRRLVAL